MIVHYGLLYFSYKASAVIQCRQQGTTISGHNTSNAHKLGHGKSEGSDGGKY